MLNIKIATVDDKESDAFHLINLIKDYESNNSDSVNFNIVSFTRGINFIDPFDDTFDVVFLDIDMPLMSGLEVAKFIREQKSSMNIVFVTNYASLAIDGYGVDAIGFLVKPIRSEDIQKVLNKITKKLLAERSDNKIIVKIKSGYQTIRVSDIKFVEINIHDVFYHTTNGVYKTRGVLKQIEKDLNHKRFAKCSSCFLVNLDFVDSIEKDNIKIGKDKLKIARTRKKEFLEAFLNNYQ